MVNLVFQINVVKMKGINGMELVKSAKSILSCKTSTNVSQIYVMKTKDFWKMEHVDNVQTIQD